VAKVVIVNAIIKSFASRDHSHDWEDSFVSLEKFVEIADEFDVGIYPEVKHGHATNEVNEVIKSLSNVKC